MAEQLVEAAARSHAVAFRTAFDVVKPEHPLLPRFPHGWCTIASILLGEYLSEAGLGEFHTRSGMRRVLEFDQTHAWLDQSGLIVDITADQFPDTDAPVIVRRRSAWHQKWAPSGGGYPASLTYYVGDDYQELIRGIYLRLRVAAEASSTTAG